MFLRKVTIENVRSLELLELSCVNGDGEVRKWTLLLGENGCGKSTMLRAIALTLAGSDGLAQLVGEIDSWIRPNAKFARVIVELETQHGERRQAKLVLGRGWTLSKLMNANKQSLSAIDEANKQTNRNYLTLAYGASRHLSTNADKAFSGDTQRLGPRARGMATLFSSDAQLEPFESWILGLEFEKSGAGRKMLESIDKYLLPDVEFAGFDKRKRALLFQTPDGVMPLSVLSDGYQNIAAWSGDLLRSITRIFRDYKNPTSARGLLLIDEIDLHLHPVWQRKLRGFLDAMFPNLQYVASTHSPLTAQQAGPGELHVLRRPVGKQARVEITQFEGVPREMMLHQLLQSPIFGLGTIDSVDVQEKRARYRSLEGRATNAKAMTERRRLGEELAALPSISSKWDGTLAPHKKTLEEVLKKLGKLASDVERPAATVRRKKVATRHKGGAK